MSARYLKCKNCSNTCANHFKFCPNCGQPIKEDLTIGVLFYNTISNYFSFDARFFKSFLPLLLKPGHIAGEFVKGKRMLYLHPAQYYLFVSLIFFFLFSFKTKELNQSFENAIQEGYQKKESIILQDSTNTTTFVQTQKVETENAQDELSFNDDEDDKKETVAFLLRLKVLDSMIATNSSEDEIFKKLNFSTTSNPLLKRIRSQLLKLYKQKASGLLQYFFDMIPIAFFLMLPVFALFFKLFYWRKGTYAHHLVFSFYYFSFLFLVFNFELTFNYFFTLPNWMEILLVFSTFFYLVIGIMKFYEQRLFTSLFKSGLILFFFSLFIIPLTVGIMIATSLILY